jgi:hypothetical protein
MTAADRPAACRPQSLALPIVFLTLVFTIV